MEILYIASRMETALCGDTTHIVVRKSFSPLCQNQCCLNRSRSAQHTGLKSDDVQKQITWNYQCKSHLHGDDGNNCCPITSHHQSSPLVTTHTSQPC
jgi:hypothetical protein